MFIEGRDGEGDFLFIKREETEKAISCLYRGKRWRRSFLVYKGKRWRRLFLVYKGKRRRRLFLVYKEGRDGEGYFLFIKREETEKVIYCLYRG